MLNIAVLLQLVGLILTFSIGTPGYFIGPLMVIAGGVLYRKEKVNRENATENNAPPKKSNWPNILGGAVLVIVLAISAVFFFTADMVATADKFFTSVKNNNIDEAYTYLSEDFRSGTSKIALQQYLKNNSLSNYKEASWESRSINGGRGKLTGSITTEAGGVVPITLNFVKGEEDWKIYSIQKPSSGLQEESSPIQIPSENDMIKLVTNSMRVFSTSINDTSMVKFHAHVSNLWQKELTPEGFDETFKVFYNAGLDLSVLENFSPRFSSKPNINEDGVLIITGHYPTEPNKVNFEQKYIYEGLGWKLIGFSVNIK